MLYRLIGSASDERNVLMEASWYEVAWRVGS